MLRAVMTVIRWLRRLHVGHSLEKVTPQYIFSKKGSYHSHTISPILLHSFGQCTIALSSAALLGSRKAYWNCVQLNMVIVLPCDMTCLHPLCDLWLSLTVKFVPYVNCAFFQGTDPARSSWDTWTRARIHKGDMTAAHAFSCLCDDFNCLVNKPRHLDVRKHMVSH